MFFLLYQLSFLLISAAIPFCACTNILLYPLRRREKLILFLYIFSILSLLGGILGQLVTPFIVGGVTVYILYVTPKGKLMNTFLALFGYLCSVVLNHVFTVSLSFFGITMQMIEAAFPLRFSVAFFVFLYGVMYFIGKVIRKKGFLYELEIPNFVSVSLFLDMLICVFIFVFNIIVGEKMGYSMEVLRLNGILFFLFFSVTFVITIVIVLNYEKEKRVTQKLKEFENLQDYTHKIEKLYMELRIFKHDYFNILSSLRAYIDSENMTGLKSYFEASILPAGEKLNHKEAVLGGLSYMKVEELKGLIYTKLFYAMQKGLQVELDIRENVECIEMDILDMTRILGIFLDNAVEAAEDSGTKRVCLGFAKKENSLLMVVENSYNQEENVDLHKINQLGVSTKGKDRGVGLFQVQKILGKYKNIIHTTTCRDGVFTQNMEIIQNKR